jgi:hypothetical protein
MAILKEKVLGAKSSRVGSRMQPKIVVKVRQQSLEEERNMEAAIGILLAEIIRQKLSCVEKS